MSSDVSDSLCSAFRIARVACMQRIVEMLWSLLKSMKLLCNVIIALPRTLATLYLVQYAAGTTHAYGVTRAIYRSLSKLAMPPLMPRCLYCAGKLSRKSMHTSWSSSAKPGRWNGFWLLFGKP